MEARFENQTNWYEEGDYADITARSQEIFEEMNLRKGVCVPTQTEEETIEEVKKNEDEITESVIEKNTTTEYTSKEGKGAADVVIETEPVEEAVAIVESISAPHTGFAAQDGANFLPVVIVSVIAIAATIAAAIIMKRKK